MGASGDGRHQNKSIGVGASAGLGCQTGAGDEAHRLSGDADYVERAACLFRTGTRDPCYEGDLNTYSATKETVNSLRFGHLFLGEWAAQ